MKRNISSSNSSTEKTTQEKMWIVSSLTGISSHSAFGIKFFLISLLRHIFLRGKYITVRTLPRIS